MTRNLTSFFLPAFVFSLLLGVTAAAQQVQIQNPRELQKPHSKVIPPVPAIPAASFRITIPFERDDLGSNFHIDNGSVLTAVTSMGSFTARDTAIRAVIPYEGEATLKFSFGLVQDWTPPIGVIWVDILKMRRNPKTGLREFFTDEQPIHSFSTAGGRITMPPLAIDEYMIRGRYKDGRLLFLPLSVRGSN